MGCQPISTPRRLGTSLEPIATPPHAPRQPPAWGRVVCGCATKACPCPSTPRPTPRPTPTRTLHRGLISSFDTAVVPPDHDRWRHESRPDVGHSPSRSCCSGRRSALRWPSFAAPAGSGSISSTPGRRCWPCRPRRWCCSVTFARPSRRRRWRPGSPRERATVSEVGGDRRRALAPRCASAPGVAAQPVDALEQGGQPMGPVHLGDPSGGLFGAQPHRGHE